MTRFGKIRKGRGQCRLSHAGRGTRAHNERVQTTTTQDRLADQLQLYADLAASEFGALYLLIALVPFCWLHRMRARERGWLLGLIAVYLCLVVLLIVVLNPLKGRESRETCKVFFSASHLVLALWTGYGLTLIGVLFAGRVETRRACVNILRMVAGR